MTKNPILLLELIQEILLRLPVRSVLCFKCVCKSWLNLISDSRFALSHHDLAVVPSQRFLLRSDDFYVESIDIEASLKDFSNSVHLPIPPPLPPLHDTYDYYDDIHQSYDILGSCKGLVLLHYQRRRDLIIWNPSTGDYKGLPYFKSTRLPEYLYGFGYDASTDDYLIVVFELYGLKNDKVHIFSFKTHSWDIKDIDVSYAYLGTKFRIGSLVNGALHWLVLCLEDTFPVILVFDLVQRSFSEIFLPEDLIMENYKLYSLRVMEGCLSVCALVGARMTEIWVMKKYDVYSSWTKCFVFPTHCIPHSRFSPICITQDGRIFGSDIIGTLEKRNDKGDLLELLTFNRDQALYKDNLQVAMYTESLLPLPVIRANKRRSTCNR